jgi:hypothetical protein
VVADIQLVPVVHARAPRLGVVDPEAERVDQVEDAARDGAHAADVAGVRRDLRLEQDEVERRLHRRRLSAARDLALGVAFLDVVPLVVLLLALADREQALGEPVLEVDLERDDGGAARLHLARDLGDLGLLEQAALRGR